MNVTRFPAAFLGLMTAAACSCAGATRVEAPAPVVEAKPTPAPVPVYTVDPQCSARQAVQAELEKSGDFVMPLMSLETDGETRPAGLGEVIGRIAEGKSRSVRVEARGGIGKSRLAAALETHLCAVIPVLLVDSRAELGEARSAADVVAAIKARLPPAGSEVLLVDSLDELTPEHRAMVVEGIARLRAANADLRLVILARSPVYPGSWVALGIDAVVRLHAVPCGDAKGRIARLLQTPEREEAFWAFAAQTGLDRKAPGDVCRYALLATFRDIETAVDVFQAFGKAKVDRPWSRAQLYLQWVHDATKEIGGRPGLKAAETDKILDTLIDAATPTSTTRALKFEAADCASFPGGRTGKLKCQSLMTSQAFRQEENRRSFKNQSLADLFLARWAARRLPGPDGACHGAAGLGALLESNDIVGFLFGMEAARPCLGALAEGLCKSGVHPQVLRELVGETVVPALTDAERVAAEAQATSECARDLVKSLAR